MKVQLYMLQTIDGKTSGVIDLDILCSENREIHDGWLDYEAGYADTYDCAIMSARTVLKMFKVKGLWPTVKVDCDFVIIDRSNSLSQETLADIRTRCRSCTHVVLGDYTGAQVGFIEYPSHNLVLKEISLPELIKGLTEYGINPKNISLQTGGTLNNVWMSSGLIDEVRVVVAPIVIGGQSNPTLCDGEDLCLCGKQAIFNLAETKILRQGYILLRYKRIAKKNSALSRLAGMA